MNIFEMLKKQVNSGNTEGVEVILHFACGGYSYHKCKILSDIANKTYAIDDGNFGIFVDDVINTLRNHLLKQCAKVGLSNLPRCAKMDMMNF